MWVLGSRVLLQPHGPGAVTASQGVTSPGAVPDLAGRTSERRWLLKAQLDVTAVGVDVHVRHISRLEASERVQLGTLGAWLEVADLRVADLAVVNRPGESGGSGC
ncbi:MAG: hypothetical protein JWR70_2871 [Modestobacter sp.]|nr:hypothetical protein [Modestobacter sp.]